MTASADIDRFQRPALGWYVLIDGSVGAAALLWLSERAHATVASKVPLPSRAAARRVVLGTLAIHVFEVSVALFVVRRRDLSRSGRRWILHTAVLGFPVLRSLQRTTGAR